jgi:hypothetical protein
MDALTPNVFDSPALGILCDLEMDGFRVALTADEALTIAPRSRLTPVADSRCIYNGSCAAVLV